MQLAFFTYLYIMVIFTSFFKLLQCISEYSCIIDHHDLLVNKQGKEQNSMHKWFFNKNYVSIFPMKDSFEKGSGMEGERRRNFHIIYIFETIFVTIIYYFSKTKTIKEVSKILNNIQLYFWSQNFKTPLRCDMHHILTLKGPSRFTGLTGFSAGHGMKFLPPFLGTYLTAL